MIGDPGGEFLTPAEVDLPGFWVRFEAAAPFHLAWGFKAATVLIAVVLPRLMGHAHGLARLSAEDADAVIQRAATLPVVAMVTEVAKIVACFAYFSDPRVQTVARGST